MKTKVWIFVAFLCTFALGYAAGFLTPRVPFRKDVRSDFRGGERRMERGFQDREARERNRAMQYLDLSADQRDEFEKASLEFQQSVRRALEEANVATRAKIRTHSDSLNIKMKSILDAEQYEKWEKFSKRREEAFQRRREG